LSPGSLHVNAQGSEPARVAGATPFAARRGAAIGGRIKGSDSWDDHAAVGIPVRREGFSVAKRTSGESEALDRLEADDVALEKTLEEARSAAGRAVAKARAAAEAEAAAARVSLEAEVAGLIEAAARDVSRIDAEARTRAEARASEVRGRALPRLDRAVELVLRVVLGEAP
jgi:hypothetical protein